MTDGTTRRYNDGEILSGVQRRRRWTPEEKVRIVEETYLPGMAEAFVRILKRDYVRVNPKPNAQSVIQQLPGWLTHYNEVHPHRALGYRSPREYIAQTREAPSGL